MAEQKRFYWIKLKENFFDLETIDWLISQKNGCEYIVLYQKLCLIAANKGGRLAMTVGEMIIPYDINKIARDTKFHIDTVVVAMELFRRIGLIYEESDGVLKIPYVNEIVGSESSSAKRVREHRKRKQNALQCNPDVTQEKEKREKSVDIRYSDTDVDVEVKADSPPCDYSDDNNKLEPLRGNVMLSENQISDLLEKMGLEAFDYYVDKLNAFIRDKGAFVKNHYETLLKWYAEDTKVKCN